METLLLLIALTATVFGLIASMLIFYNLVFAKISHVYANGRWHKLGTWEQTYYSIRHKNEVSIPFNR